MEKKQGKPNLLLVAIGAVVMGCCLCSCLVGGLAAGSPVVETPSQVVAHPSSTHTAVTMAELPTPTFTHSPEPVAISSPTMTLTAAPALTATETLLAVAGIDGAECIPAQAAQTGKVVDVVDGDTIKVLIEGKVYSVRYIGMDTPEDTTTREFFGPEATTKNAEIVFGKEVVLIKDVSETDRYGRLVRYVLVGNLFVNLELVKLGFANAYPYPPDTSCENTFRAAEENARKAKLGFWGIAPTATLKPAATPNSGDGGGSGGNCDPSYPGVCIPPAPPDLDCGDIPYRRFKVLPPDPHRFDGDHDGVGCESG